MFSWPRWTENTANLKQLEPPNAPPPQRRMVCKESALMRKGRKDRTVDQIASPTAEQLRHGAFAVEDITDKRRGGGSITIGKAYRRRPMIDVLFAADVLSQDEYKALRHYRHHAD